MDPYQLSNGSGSGLDPDSPPDPALFISGFQDVIKFFCFLLFEGAFMITLISLQR
jgi:hypothetical protein